MTWLSRSRAGGCVTSPSSRSGSAAGPDPSVRRAWLVSAVPDNDDPAMDVGLVLNLAVKAAGVGFAVVPLVQPEASHFQGKAMR